MSFKSTKEIRTRFPPETGSDYLVLAPQVGLEPTTTRLTAGCSAIELLRNKFRQRPTLPGRLQPSTIGTEGLNFCVRDGNRWNPFVITTGNGEHICLVLHPDNCTSRETILLAFLLLLISFSSYLKIQANRPISIIKLHTLLCFHR